MAEPLPPLLKKKRLVSVVLETTSGTFNSAGTFTPLAANLYDIKCEIGDIFAEGERQAQGNYVGSVASVSGKIMSTVEYDMDVAPAGPLLGQLVYAGYKLTTGVYAPTSDFTNRQTASLKVWEDGRLKGAIAGAVCEVSLTAEAGKPLKAHFKWSGTGITVSDSAMPAQAPITALPYICRGVTCTFGGTAIPHWSKITFDLGGKAEEREGMLSATAIAHYVIGDIEPTIDIDPEARKVADHDAYGLYRAGTTFAFSAAFTSGATTLTIAAPAAQRRQITDGARGTRATDELKIECHISSGDDALTFAEA